MDLRHFQRAIVVLVAFSWRGSARGQRRWTSRPRRRRRPENGKVFVSWRLLGTDNAAMAFNVYRDDGNDRPVKVNGQPLAATNFMIPARPSINRTCTSCDRCSRAVS